VTYSPDAGYTGVDTFKYTVADSQGAVSNQATVTVTVNAVSTEVVVDNGGLEHRIRGYGMLPAPALTGPLWPRRTKYSGHLCQRLPGIIRCPCGGPSIPPGARLCRWT
jgi:hypothetical protein